MACRRVKIGWLNICHGGRWGHELVQVDTAGYWSPHVRIEILHMNKNDCDESLLPRMGDKLTELMYSQKRNLLRDVSYKIAVAVLFSISHTNQCNSQSGKLTFEPCIVATEQEI